MVKTNTQHLLPTVGRESISRTKGDNEARDAQQTGADRVQSNVSQADQTGQTDTVEVARAKAVFARTEHAAAAVVGKEVSTQEEAASLVAEVTGQIGEDSATAIAAQAGRVSAHLVELLGYEKDG